MRPLLLALAVLCVSLLPVAPVQAQDLSLSSFESIQTLLASRRGKSVTVRLSGGQELTGVVREANTRTVVLGALSGREFFDAAIPMEKIEAVLVRTK